jgi:DoxX-like family
MLRKILYWLTTGLLALAYAAGAFFDLTQPEQVVEGAKKLGYPLFFFSILGFWKMGAVVAILAPGLPRLKEWAYAGIVINLTGAAATHASMKDYADVPAPLVLLALTIASWALRPAGRKLEGPWV